MILRAIFRVPGAVLHLIPYVPAYLAGALYESVRQGWWAGRADAKALSE